MTYSPGAAPPFPADRLEPPPLCDARRFGASLGQASRGARRDWRAGAEDATGPAAASRTRLPAPA